jgi:hypothetical protein
MLKLNFYTHEKVLTDEMIRLDLQKIGLFDAICIAGLVLLIGVYW